MNIESMKMKNNIISWTVITFSILFSFLTLAEAAAFSAADGQERKGEGIYVDNVTSLAAAVSPQSMNAKEIVISNNTHLGASITVSNNKALRFVKGGKITVAKGKRLTIDCHIEADVAQHIFDGDGEVVFGSNSDHNVSICWKGAKNTNKDNSPFIQWALDQMSAIQGTVIVPPGDYRYTSALKITSNTTIQGAGRKFSTTLHPINCAAITMDGTSVEGGWIFRTKIKNLTFYGNESTGFQNDNLFFLHNVYNVELEDIWIYNQKTPVGIFIKNCNDVIISNLIVYGVDTGSSRRGIYSENSSLKMITPDIENLYTGIQCAGGGSVDIISPYIERCIVGYRHAATTGATRIFGGTISSINGYCIDVQGDHLYVYGTDLAPYQGENPGGVGINTTTKGKYPNVFFHDIPKAAQTGFFDRSTNWLNLHITGTIPVPGYNKGNIDFEKKLKNKVTTDVVEFDSVEYANCELRIFAPIHASSSISKVYTFAIANGSSSPIIERFEVNSGNSVKNIILTVTIKQITTTRCTITVRADGIGNWQGDKIPLNMQLSYQAKTTPDSKIVLL